MATPPDPDARKALLDMQEEVWLFVQEKGWDDNRSFGDAVALMHSEVSEGLEEFRDHGLKRYVEDPTGFPYTQIHYLEDQEDYPDGLKPEGVPSEYADQLIRLLHNCKKDNVNLYSEFRAKMDYNWTRAYRHGGKAL